MAGDGPTFRSHFTFEPGFENRANAMVSLARGDRCHHVWEAGIRFTDVKRSSVVDIFLAYRTVISLISREVYQSISTSIDNHNISIDQHDHEIYYQSRLVGSPLQSDCRLWCESDGVFSLWCNFGAYFLVTLSLSFLSDNSEQLLDPPAYLFSLVYFHMSTATRVYFRTVSFI